MLHHHPHHEDPAEEAVTLSVAGMTCRHCARAVSARLADVPGVVAVEADIRSATVRVSGTARPALLRAAVADAGHDAVLLAATPVPTDDPEVPR